MPGHQVDLGPSPTELFRTFRMPVFTLLVGAAFLAVGLATPTSGHNIATVLGIVVLVLSALLICMELRDLDRPWVAWDSLGITLGRRGKTPLTLLWDDVADVRLHEVIGGRRYTPGNTWLYLEVRPSSWEHLALGVDAAAYQSLALSEEALGVPASAGDSWRIQLDQKLRAEGLPSYAGIVTTHEVDPRAIWRRPKADGTSRRRLI